MSPSVIRPGAGSIPRIHCVVTLLPEPDSPASPTISPRLIWKLTPFSAWILPAGSGNSALRFSISSNTDIHRPQLLTRQARGSSKSRRPSPNRLNAYTDNITARPAKRGMVGLLNIYCRPVVSISPHEEVGG